MRIEGANRKRVSDTNMNTSTIEPNTPFQQAQTTTINTSLDEESNNVSSVAKISVTNIDNVEKIKRM